MTADERPERASTEDWCETAPEDGHAWSYTHHAGIPRLETRRCMLCGYFSVQPIREALTKQRGAGLAEAVEQWRTLYAQLLDQLDSLYHYADHQRSHTSGETHILHSLYRDRLLALATGGERHGTLPDPQPGHVRYKIEAWPHNPGVNGETYESGHLPAAEAANNIRRIADHIEEFWGYPLIEVAPTPADNPPDEAGNP